MEQSFLTEFAAAAKPSATPLDAFRAQTLVLEKWLFEDPRGLFDELRRDAPVFVPPGLAPAIVSRFQDVVEVAALDGVYSVKPYSGAMMRDNGGPNFILGMDDSPRFDFDLSVLKLAIQRDDLPRIAKTVSTLANEKLAAALPAGQIDVVEGFGRRIPLEMIGHYFGVPGPDVDTLGRWTRAIFTDIFFNLTQDAAVADAGTKAGKAFADYVDKLIADMKNGTASPRPADDTVIGRLVAMQRSPQTSLNDLAIRTNLTGCITGVTDNTVAAVVGALDNLLERPDALAGAAAAARANDDALLTKYVFEALRFAPAAPFLVRLALEDHVIAKGTDREAKIPAGKLVMAATCSAMLDPAAVDDPLSFRLDRPSYQNLQFGWGVHGCLGRHISTVQIAQIVKAVLLMKNVRRAPGAAGKPTWQGPFPVRFAVAFDR